NFDPTQAQNFLCHIAEICGMGGGLLIGIDLKKDACILEPAYNDAKGVTAAFNLNLLRRINRELGADFQLDRFQHYAFYNQELGRIEMHLVSLQNQTVQIGETRIAFAQGETFHTENSHKYSLSDFAVLAASAGFKMEKVWTDANRLFGVQYLARV
ncbi:MAG TPA: L-histidine N(alpha)-methyltransferase, partial [Abditibacteriaceae bacterium]|nr:L-histidine N(alpha)-methyltransferase [Abditibacteriaceae bacterium]